MSVALVAIVLSFKYMQCVMLTTHPVTGRALTVGTYAFYAVRSMTNLLGVALILRVQPFVNHVLCSKRRSLLKGMFIIE